MNTSVRREGLPAVKSPPSQFLLVRNNRKQDSHSFLKITRTETTKRGLLLQDASLSFPSSFCAKHTQPLKANETQNDLLSSDVV